MIVEPVPGRSCGPTRSCAAWSRTGAVVAWGSLGSAGTAAAQATAGSPSSGTIAEPPPPVGLFGRADSATVWVLVAAIVIVAILVWRVWAMVRKERPVVVPPRRRPAPAGGGGDALDRFSMQRPTDWGYEPNKRAATDTALPPARQAPTGPPLQERVVARWSATDVRNAREVAVHRDDSLGKPPNVTPSPYKTGGNPYFERSLLASRVGAAEVANPLLQAELLVHLGDPKQAMTLLSQHIRDTEVPAPAAWLMLLNLYQSTGREAQYDALATGFRTLFNAEVPPWATSPDQAGRELESYPQVLARLQAMWPAPDTRAIIEALLNDDRGGSRQGFSLTAYRDLLFLLEILDAREEIERDDEEMQGIRRKLAGAAGQGA